MTLSLLVVFKVLRSSDRSSPPQELWIGNSNFRTTLQAWSIPGSGTALSIQFERYAGN